MYCSNCYTYSDNCSETRSFVERLTYDDTVTIVQAVEDVLSVVVNISSSTDPSGNIPRLCNECVDQLETCHRHLDRFLKRSHERGLISDLLNERGKGNISTETPQPVRVIKTEKDEDGLGDSDAAGQVDGSEEILGLDYNDSSDADEGDVYGDYGRQTGSLESADTTDYEERESSDRLDSDMKVEITCEDVKVNEHNECEIEEANMAEEGTKVLELPLSDSYNCPTESCSESFVYKAELLNHLFDHELTKMKMRSIKRKGCPRISRKCCLCPYKAKRTQKSEMLSHFSTSHTQEEVFKCPECDLSFMAFTEMKRHQSRVHMDKSSRLRNVIHSADSRRAVFTSSRTVRTKIKCSQCAMTFTSEAKKDEHVSRMHVKLPVGDRKKAKLESSIYVVVSKEDELFTKIICDPSPYSRVEKFYKCNQEDCSFSVSCRKVILEHCRDRHRKLIKPFKCPEPGCLFSTNLNATLKHHYMSVHAKEKPFSCSFKGCKYKTSSRNSIRIHERRKHGRFHRPIGPGGGRLKEPTICSVCNKNLKAPGYLKDHMKMHNEEDPLKCTVSGCTFTSYSRPSLWRHLKSHDLSKHFLCPHCGKRVVQKSVLRNHIEKMHPEQVPKNAKPSEKEERVLCSVCGKYFSKSYNLQVHMRTHTGLRPFNCKLCDYATTQKSPLKTHYLKKHGVTMDSVDPAACAQKVKLSNVVYLERSNAASLKTRKSD